MTTTTATTSGRVPTGATAATLADRLAAVFRTGDVDGLFTEDVFLDGHPPYWRFQLQGIEPFQDWLRGYVVSGAAVRSVRSVATDTGFVAELVSEHDGEDGIVSSRDLVLATTRGDRIAELTVFCSGEWDAELRARHAAEAPMLRG